MVRLILGSSSPRRRQLLQLLKIEFDTVPPIDIDETLPAVFSRESLVALSERKAEEVWLRNTEAIVLGADTVVVLNNTVLGKPNSKEEAIKMLLDLSGMTHHVYTAVSLTSRAWRVNFIEETAVSFRNIPEWLIREYVETGIPLDKAGAYGIQDYGAIFVERINGDYYNVMGLPVGRLWQELHFRGVI